MNAEKLELRRKERAEKKELARIESEKNQKPVKEITINIEWAKSRTWGSNPQLNASIHYRDLKITKSWNLPKAWEHTKTQRI